MYFYVCLSLTICHLINDSLNAAFLALCYKFDFNFVHMLKQVLSCSRVKKNLFGHVYLWTGFIMFTANWFDYIYTNWLHNVYAQIKLSVFTYASRIRHVFVQINTNLNRRMNKFHYVYTMQARFFVYICKQVLSSLRANRFDYIHACLIVFMHVWLYSCMFDYIHACLIVFMWDWLYSCGIDCIHAELIVFMRGWLYSCGIDCIHA